MFDQGGLVSHIPTWDWEDAGTWRQVYNAYFFCPNSRQLTNLTLFVP